MLSNNLLSYDSSSGKFHEEGSNEFHFFTQIWSDLKVKATLLL